MRKIPIYRQNPLLPIIYAKVDDSDYEYLKNFTWYYFEYKLTAYAKTFISGKCVSMQNLIMGKVEGLLIDHKNGDGLDNQRENLRFATLEEQRQNIPKHQGSTSKYKCVSWDNTRKRWVVQLHHNGIHYHGGRFRSEIEAAHAADELAKKHHGEFARLNFPGDKIQ